MNSHDTGGKTIEAVLQCDGIAKSFTDGISTIDVLKNASLAVAEGEMIAIIGTSGSGKSTLMHILAGLDKPTSGIVKILDHDIHTLDESEKCRIRNQHLGFIYQFHHLLPEFSALENVAMPLLIRGEEPAMITDKALHLLDKVGLSDRTTHRLNALSGGERQRVAIARALISEPACILADEPTGNLDPQNAKLVLDLFFDLQSTLKTSVVMVTHEPGIAARANKIFKLDHGELIAQ